MSIHLWAFTVSSHGMYEAFCPGNKTKQEHSRVQDRGQIKEKSAGL